MHPRRHRCQRRTEAPTPYASLPITLADTPQTLLRDRPWHIAQSNALTGDGIEEGIAWLVGELTKR